MFKQALAIAIVLTSIVANASIDLSKNLLDKRVINCSTGAISNQQEKEKLMGALKQLSLSFNFDEDSVLITQWLTFAGGATLTDNRVYYPSEKIKKNLLELKGYKDVTNSRGFDPIKQQLKRLFSADAFLSIELDDKGYPKNLILMLEDTEGKVFQAFTCILDASI